MIDRVIHRSIDAGPRNIAVRRSVGVVLSCVAVVSMNACYAFIPTTSAVLAEKTPVTISLTLGGTVALQSTLGQGVNELDGVVLRSSADSLVLSVENMYTVGHQKFQSSGTTASIPRPYIQDVKVRTFSRKRTTLTILGALALAIGGAAGVSAGSSSGNPGGGVVIPP